VNKYFKLAVNTFDSLSEIYKQEGHDGPESLTCAPKL